MKKYATLSPCGRYRYWLERRWEEGKDYLNWVMLNPSTADASIDDQTIRKCIGFARLWGFGGIHVTNLFALRATNPRWLYREPDPVGPDNDHYIEAGALSAPMTVVAWGKHGCYRGRSKAVMVTLCRLCPKVVALKFNADGSPGHPCYLGYELKPIDMVTPAGMKAVRA